MSTIEQETRRAPRACLHGGYHQPGQCPEAAVDLVVPSLMEDYTDCEVTNAEVIGESEAVEVAIPGKAGRYLRLISPDLVKAIDGARRLLDQIEEAVLDARQERSEAALVECGWCRTLIDPDEDSCGSGSCARMAAAERRVEASI